MHCLAYIPSLAGLVCAGGSYLEAQTELSDTCLFFKLPQKRSASAKSHALPKPLKLTGTKTHQIFSNFCCNDSMSDVVLQSRGIRFPAHKIILAAASPRFHAMFDSLEKDTSGQVVKKNPCDVNQW